MARYIDLEELAKRIGKYVKAECPEEKELVEWCKDECIRQGYCMLTADVAEVKHGKWDFKRLDRFRKYRVKCPFCEAEYIGNYDAYDEPEDFNFCPNCGARMDGE